MNKFLMPVLGACLVLGACNKGAPPANETPAAPAAQAPAPAAGAVPAAAADAAAPGRGPLTAQQVDAIKASGKTGLWSDPAETCAGDNPRATVTWNVEQSGVDQVVVTLLNKAKGERVFAQGRAIGQKQTGPWLRPGMTFKLRAKADNRELATLQVPEGKDCAAAAK